MRGIVDGLGMQSSRLRMATFGIFGNIGYIGESERCLCCFALADLQYSHLNLQLSSTWSLALLALVPFLHSPSPSLPLSLILSYSSSSCFFHLHTTWPAWPAWAPAFPMRLRCCKTWKYPTNCDQNFYKRVHKPSSIILHVNIYWCKNERIKNEQRNKWTSYCVK